MTTSIHLPAEALSALVDASAAINSADDLDETLNAIARCAVAVMKAQDSSVILLDEARNKQVFRVVVGDHAEKLVGTAFDRDKGISGKVLKTSQAILENTVEKNKDHFKEFDAKIPYQTHSIIAAPLIAKGKTLGVVEVLNPVQAKNFSEGDFEICKVFANLAATAIMNAMLREKISLENIALKTHTAPPKMIGQCSMFKHVQTMIERVAQMDTTVLLQGETGTGKELIAQSVHQLSPRTNGPFVPVNCAAIPETLLESELFGYEPGAFTGADKRKAGRFEMANGGTIFLDEITEISPAAQVKLLRVLQEREFIRLGGQCSIGCDVRVIAATNRDLASETKRGNFREDLFYRISVFPIFIPPLRERADDIPLLVEYFIERKSHEMKIAPPKISHAAIDTLKNYRFPGNIRELQNIIERAILLARPIPNGKDGQTDTIEPQHLPRQLTQSDHDTQNPATLADHEKNLVISALESAGWNQSKAARKLGISRDNIRYRIKKYAIERK